MNGTDLRKWGARTIVAVSGLLIMWASSGTWDTEETIALITLVTAAATSILVPPKEEQV